MKKLTDAFKQEMMRYTPFRIVKEFHIACYSGHYDHVHYFLTHPPLKKHLHRDIVQAGLVHACQTNKISVVQLLFQMESLDIHFNHDEAFRIACTMGHLNLVQYLLTSPELREHADIHALSDNGLRWACIKGHLNVVRYLLNSPELTAHADIHAKDDECFFDACDNENFEALRCLFTDPALTEHINFHKHQTFFHQWCQEHDAMSFYEEIEMFARGSGISEYTFFQEIPLY